MNTALIYTAAASNALVMRTGTTAVGARAGAQNNALPLAGRSTP
ncbi:MAG: hypothetical protein ABSC56_14040 [Solirubrobacteraceae bacterium]|jgi:hypothetical protein